jgi:hypothetical protein
MVRLHEEGVNYPHSEAENGNQEKDERQLSEWIGIAATPPKHEIER